MKAHQYEIKVTTKARRAGVTKNADGTLSVKVHAAPEKGKANQEVLGLLAETFGVAKQCVTIIKGQTGRKKIIQIKQ